ncbi:MAG: tRNA (cytidine(34)-2'-O)-methyltransferase [Nesterenkonia sp.]|nr:tRNA (cytidine(34)-2'-O)-methyltransferase [Nesterenkonia sp.]
MRVLVDQPEIPGNTGNLIRLAAVTGMELHLAEPVGFDFDDAKLRRAGLDYHDLAVLTVHPSLDEAYRVLRPQRVLAYTGGGESAYTDVEHREGDVLLFGRESTGLDEHVLEDPRVAARVRIPMLPSRRSLNLANAVSVVVYDAWRRQGFPGAV